MKRNNSVQLHGASCEYGKELQLKIERPQESLSRVVMAFVFRLGDLPKLNLQLDKGADFKVHVEDSMGGLPQPL